MKVEVQNSFDDHALPLIILLHLSLIIICIQKTISPENWTVIDRKQQSKTKSMPRIKRIPQQNPENQPIYASSQQRRNDQSPQRVLGHASRKQKMIAQSEFENGIERKEKIII